MTRSPFSLAALTIWLFSASLLADEVHLIDGSKLIGQVKQVSGGKVAVKTEFAGEITFDATKIRTIIDAPPIFGGKPLCRATATVGMVPGTPTIPKVDRSEIEKVISNLNLTKGYARTADGEFTREGLARYEALVAEWSKAITLDTQVKADQVHYSVTVAAPDRQLAAIVANQFVENYIRRLRGDLERPLIEEKKLSIHELELCNTRIEKLVALVSNYEDKLNPIATSLERARNEREVAAIQARNLKEIIKDGKPSDNVILELSRLLTSVELGDKRIAELDNKIKEIKGGDSLSHKEYLDRRRELDETRKQLVLWQERYKQATTAQTLDPASRWVKFFERAAILPSSK